METLRGAKRGGVSMDLDMTPRGKSATQLGLGGMTSKGINDFWGTIIQKLSCENTIKHHFCKERPVRKHLGLPLQNKIKKNELKK